MTVNGPEYRRAEMLDSPGGHELRTIAGNAGDIEDRGRWMVNLGERMQEAANTLNHIASGTVGKGLSIDKLRDSAEGVHVDLKAAGVRYAPSGAVLEAYGRSLGEVQSPIASIVDSCESLWESVRRASHALEDAEASGEDASAQQSVFDAAVSEWREEARRYDPYYASWDSAYAAAVNGLEDANDNGVEDSFLDNALPALEALAFVLMIAGFVFAIAACIIGGPFILAAALIGLASLGVTLLLAAGGRADGQDVFWAAVGVFPFGKAFSAFKGVAAASGLGGRALAGLNGLGGMVTDMVGLGGRSGSRALSGVLNSGLTADVFHAGGTVINRNGTRVLREFFSNNQAMPSIFQRLTQGFDSAAGAHLADAAGGLSHKAQQNLTQFLSGSADGSALAGLMDDVGGVGTQIANVLDNPVKASIGLVTGDWSLD
jgi:hypothetical protein